MKAWTLIAFYLSKDIWSRWCEHPSAPFARLLVGVLLATLLLLAQAGFVLAGRSLETRVARLGAGTILVSEATSPDHLGRATLGELLAPLSHRADVLSFRQMPVTARDPLGGECLVFAYGRDTHAALASLIAAAPSVGLHYLNASIPAGATFDIEVDGLPHVAASVPPPSWLGRMPVLNPVVIIPDELAEAWNHQAHLELCLLLTEPTRRENVRALAQSVRALLVAERRETAHVQSPELLLDEIARLEVMRERTQALAGVGGGIVLALVFGAIAGLEYRENRYIAALLRSFGSPSPLIVLRYGAEAFALLFVAGALAKAIACGVHTPLFRLAGFEPGVLDRSVVDPYGWDLIWGQLRWLVAGAVLSVIPVIFALRAPVGRTLQ